MMGKHCLGCSTLPTFYHGIRSHALVTQCVCVRACKHPRQGHEETGLRLFVPTNMSPLLQKKSNAHKKQGPRTHTQSVLCPITLLGGLAKTVRMHKHASETRSKL